jgi:hypothetical protein
VLIPPGCRFRVKSVLDQGDLTIIQLLELPSKEWIMDLSGVDVEPEPEPESEPESWNSAAARANPRWVQPGEVKSCTLCFKVFGMTRWPYNCYHCGAMICHDCSKNKLVLERQQGSYLMPGQPKAGGTGPLRVCDSCFKHIPLDKEVAAREAETRQRLEAERQQEASQHAVLKEAMVLHGLSPEEQAKLIEEGVGCAKTFNSLSDHQLALSGIDVEARREEKRKRDQLAQVKQIAGAVGVSAAMLATLQVTSVAELKDLGAERIQQLKTIGMAALRRLTVP